MKLRIKTVDHFGYNGRDFHPADSDIGLLVTPLKLETHVSDISGEGDEYEALDRRGNLEPRFLTVDPDWIWRVWTAVTDDGRILELIDFEVEIVN